MEISQIIPHVEALIFAADRPLPLLEIVELLNNALAFLEDRVTLDQVEAAIEAIREKYNTAFYAFEVRQSGGGYQFLTKKEYYQTVAQLNGDKFLKRLSTAALETLAIIAYRQPISKSEIEYIRGVSTDYSIQKLLEKELIVITGRSEDQPGKPLLYAVSRSFMDYFGISSTADLPKLKELFEEETVQPTFINDETGSNVQENLHANTAAGTQTMMVSETGTLVQPEEPDDTVSAAYPFPEKEKLPVPGNETTATDDANINLEDKGENTLEASADEQELPESQMSVDEMDNSSADVLKKSEDKQEDQEEHNDEKDNEI